MVPDIRETIVALSSPPGPGGRAIVRLSGPSALACARSVFQTEEIIEPSRRHCYGGQIRLSGIHSPLPADLHFWPEPRTYTGQELVELHTLSCPPLVELLIAQLLSAGARAAQRGEFSLRAFLAGKLDLTQAEAVLGVIEAGNRNELMQALRQLAGGMAQPLAALRSDLLDLLADVEAGLDFSEEDISFVAQAEVLKRLAAGLAHLRLLERQLEQRSLAGATLRAVLVGRPNAGKSSLFNALAGKAAALVSPEPGTTRDYLVHPLDLDGAAVDLIDSAGRQPVPPVLTSDDADGGTTETIDQQAQRLGREQADAADLLLLCVEAGQVPHGEEQLLLGRQGPRPVVGVATKCDLHPAESGWLATSAVTGAGLDALRERIKQKVQALRQPPMAPSGSRCRHHVRAALGYLGRAYQMVQEEDPPELLAVELRGALDELGAMVGAIYTDDLLDRIFSRFCIGK
jgi:tRNA modification GTPase